MFGFGGVQRSYSFSCFHADIVPNSLSAVKLPNVPCELVSLQNDPDSTGNVIIGSERIGVVGTGLVLAPGQSTGWISVNNLNLIWHKDSDATSHLNYWAITCGAGNPLDTYYLIQEIAYGNRILTEDGQYIRLEP